MLNVDPGGNDQRDPGTAQRQKKEKFVMQAVAVAARLCLFPGRH